MMQSTKPLVRIENLRVGYRQGKQSLELIRPFAQEVYPGELICLLGPNGSGKSTLMRTLSGLQKPLSGSIFIHGNNLFHYSRKALAKQLSLVLTERIRIGPMKVYHMLSLGRYPHLGWTGRLSDRDKSVIQEAVRQTGIDNFLERQVEELSDGETQKVMIARALIQDTPLIFLDEPTAHLDLPNRLEILELLRRLTREAGKTIILSTHELSLALRMADRIWLLQADQSLHTGSPEDLLWDGALGRAFAKPGYQFDEHTGSFFPEKTKALQELRLVGEAGRLADLTHLALQRLNYTHQDQASLVLRWKQTDETCHWILEDKSTTRIFDSISELSRYLRALAP